MMTHLGLISPVVATIWSMFPEVVQCWPQFFSIIIRFLGHLLEMWLVNTTTINANSVSYTCFCWGMTHVCSAGPGSASCAEDIFMAIFPEVVPSSTGSAAYLWSTCVSMVASARLHLAPSFWALHLPSFRLFCHYFYLFLDSSERINPVNLTSVVGRIWDI